MINSENLNKIYTNAYSYNGNRVSGRYVRHDDVDLLLEDEVVSNYYKKCLSRIKEYLESDTTLLKFKKQKNIDNILLSKMEFCVEVLNPDIYNEYKKKVEMEEQHCIDVVSNTYETLFYYINNGIEDENGNKRKFDIIDFYNLSDIPIVSYYDTYIKFLNDIDEKELKDSKYMYRRVISKFITSNDYKETNTEKEIDDFLKFSTIIGGVELTEEDKLYIISYLQDRKIPIVNGIITATARRYVNKNLDSKIEYVKK